MQNRCCGRSHYIFSIFRQPSAQTSRHTWWYRLKIILPIFYTNWPICLKMADIGVHIHYHDNCVTTLAHWSWYTNNFSTFGVKISFSKKVSLSKIAGFCGQTADGSKLAVICSVATLVLNLSKMERTVLIWSLFWILVLILNILRENSKFN